jgi:S-adenosylmethionine-diacylglycerol 3-amino-3-carboxypropyl transferase
MALFDWINSRMFNVVHRNNLVYNTCWEDPRLDRVALELGRDATVLMITSAGCNALDYALLNPRKIYAVDMNPRQNALLELKIAGIRHLEFAQFFQMFGRGILPDAREVYRRQLRPDLSGWSQRYWDQYIKFFAHPRRSFYFRGTSGYFARLMNWYVDRVLRIRPAVDEILRTSSVDQQRAMYQEKIRPRLWTRSLRFAMGRNTTLSLVGVPRDQRRQVERDYEGGIVRFVQDCVDAVFGELPLQDNYFWRVYLTGQYQRECCPEYLQAENFQRLKAGLVDCIEVHTNSLHGFLEQHAVAINRFVLLDHMDWLSAHLQPFLELEWQAIVRRAGDATRLIWRSGGLKTDFVDRVKVEHAGRTREVGEMLHYHEQLARQLHAQDRVHTYGSFYIADLAA